MKSCCGMRAVVLFAVALALPVRAVTGQRWSRPIVIEDVTVLPMDGVHVVLPHRTVVVRGDTIRVVSEATKVGIPSGALRIDGRGKYLLPGLIDAHVHLQEAADLQQFVAAGVTSVRNLTGSPADLEWRRLAAAGTIVSPRIVTSGPMFAGPEIPWRDKVVPRTAEAARAEVRRQKAAGYDLIKIYDGLASDVYEAIIEEANKTHMMVTGHIPATVHLAGVLRARQSLEHTDKILHDVWGHQFDSTRVDSVARAIAAAGVWVTPTIASMEQLARVESGGFDSLLARPEARRVSDGTLAFWCSVTGRLRTAAHPATPGTTFDPYTEAQFSIIRAELKAGVSLVAGTDYPNALLAPGSSLIEELRALVDAGLSPLQAITAATRTAAAALGEANSGIIVQGARGDLLLLASNPLDDLHALDSPVGVVLAGRWLPRAELDRIAPVRKTNPSCPTRPAR